MTLVSLTYCTRFLASTSSNPCCSRTLIIDVLPKLLLTPTSSLKRTKPLIHDQIRSYTKDNEPNTSRRNERPSIYQLEHVQKRLEFTVPYLFQYHLDYTFYRDDVVLKDDILKLERRGLSSVRNYFGLVAFSGMFFFPYMRAQALNIYPIQDDGTVRLRWRIFYVTYFQFIPILYYRVFKKVDLMEKRCKWYDGYSIFHVDGDGLVYKFTLQKIIPDNERNMNIKNKTQRLVNNVAPSPINCSKK